MWNMGGLAATDAAGRAVVKKHASPDAINTVLKQIRQNIKFE